MQGRLRIVSWNIHGCVGVDGRFDPDRIARTLADLAPDVALLQEVGDNIGAHPPVDQATILADVLGMTSVLGTTLMRSAYGYGIVTLSRLPVAESEAYDLSVRGREPRVCLCASITGGDVAMHNDVAAAHNDVAAAHNDVAAAHNDVAAAHNDVAAAHNGYPPLRTVNVHLGLGRRERRTQIGILFDEAGPLLDDPTVPLVIGGDLNDWPPGAATRTFESLFIDAARAVSRRPAATFPSRRPLLRLDRVYVSAAVEVRSCVVYDAPLARLASDHLPILVEVALVPPARRLRG